MTTTYRTGLKLVLGNTLSVLAASQFLVPNGFICGGITGTALLIQHHTGVATGISLAVLTPALFLLGTLVFGREYALKTVLISVLYPLTYNLFSLFSLSAIVQPPQWLAAVMGGALVGCGVCMVMQCNSGAGGYDVIALILRRFGIPIAITYNVIDTLLLLLQASYSSLNRIAYGLLAVVVTAGAMTLYNRRLARRQSAPVQ